MLSDKDRQTIVELAGHYQARRVLLFGSSALPGSNVGRDIDLAVEGIADGQFFRFWGDLMLRASKPVDVIDLSHPGKFSDIVRREGVLLYGLPV